ALLRLQRSAAVVSEQDARQLFNGMYTSLLAALEGQEGEQREIFFEDALVPAYTNGLSVAGAVKGTVRTYSFLIGTVVPRLPPEAQGPAAEWLAEWVSNFSADVVRAGVQGS